MTSLDHAICYRVVQSRDRRFDGVFYTGVTTTGIFCRPSCPATTPKPGNVRFYSSAAAAHSAGFRACRRCLPDAVPGSPDWDAVADVAGRAMRMIRDGVVERDGVEGLARQLGYSVRQLNRLVTAEWGAGPLALARAQRAQTARVLLETTELSVTEIAFAAGFASVRQFNDTILAVYGSTPRELRARPRAAHRPDGAIAVRLAVREPYDRAGVLAFLSRRAVPGVEAVGASTYARTLRLPHGTGVVEITLASGSPGIVPCQLWLSDLRDLAPAVERARRLVDADCDPVAVDAHLAEDPRLGRLVAQTPGIRVPGHVDGFELAIRAVLGQQVTVAAARTLTTRLVESYGDPLATHRPDLTRLFPTAAALTDSAPAGMPRTRQRTVAALARAVAEGLSLDRGTDRTSAVAALLDLPGIGSWTAGYVAMRALGDPDVFLARDAAVRQSAARLGVTQGELVDASEAWRPWRSYALMHLWRLAAGTEIPS